MYLAVAPFLYRAILRLDRFVFALWVGFTYPAKINTIHQLGS
jgi:hypothetical protein